MKRPQQPAIQWRTVWKALHDMSYDLIDVHTAIDLCYKAGHPSASALVHRTVKHGYELSKELHS
jgi:hypothetical protein